MGIVAIITLCGIISQTPPGDAGIKTYRVQVRGEAEPRYVQILSRSNVSMEVLSDEPWRKDLIEERIQLRQVEPDGITLEESALRADRIKRGWIAHHGVEMTTRTGRRVWILGDEKDLADRSKQLVASAFTQSADSVSGGSPLPPGASHEGPGVAQLWAPHAAVVAAAIALMCGVYFLLLRRREEWQPLDSGSPTPRRR